VTNISARDHPWSFHVGFFMVQSVGRSVLGRAAHAWVKGLYVHCNSINISTWHDNYHSARDHPWSFHVGFCMVQPAGRSVLDPEDGIGWFRSREFIVCGQGADASIIMSSSPQTFILSVLSKPQVMVGKLALLLQDRPSAVGSCREAKRSDVPNAVCCCRWAQLPLWIKALSSDDLMLWSCLRSREVTVPCGCICIIVVNWFTAAVAGNIFWFCTVGCHGLSLA